MFSIFDKLYLKAIIANVVLLPVPLVPPSLNSSRGDGLEFGVETIWNVLFWPQVNTFRTGLSH